jgi:putative nucleotidyltransferase with HDIG domain
MRLRKRDIVLIASGALLLALAIDFMGIKAGYVFLAAGAAVILVSVSSGWANGILSGLFFNFAFYSMHTSAGLANIAINTAVYTVFAVLGDRIRLTPSNAHPSGSAMDEEKVFANKITNSFMLAHDMLLEIKKGLSRGELLSLLARNVSNLCGCSHVMIYMPERQGDANMTLKHSFGAYQDRTARESVAENELSGAFLKSVPSGQVNLFGETTGGFMSVVPVRGDRGLSGAAVLYKESGFTHNDIYIAEFFTAQVFIILEKQDMLKQMSDNHESIMETLAMAIDVKDHDTHGHSLSTMKYALQIAQKMNLPAEECERIKCAALLHDIGKIKTNSEILKKPSSLTAEEYEAIKKHPQDGVNILNSMDLFEDILPIILYHHEHFDGKGYPEKLKGEKIPLGSRICAVADAYSVMLSDRPYRRALTREEAAAELKRCAGSQFDSRIVGVFLDSMESGPAKDGVKKTHMDLVN